MQSAYRAMFRATDAKDRRKISVWLVTRRLLGMTTAYKTAPVLVLTDMLRSTTNQLKSAGRTASIRAIRVTEALMISALCVASLGAESSRG